MGKWGKWETMLFNSGVMECERSGGWLNSKAALIIELMKGPGLVGAVLFIGLGSKRVQMKSKSLARFQDKGFKFEVWACLWDL